MLGEPSIQSVDIHSTGVRARPKLTPALAALTVGALLAAYHWHAGFPDVVWNGDNDNMLRLVQVRDLIAGQGWLDTRQYRMGEEGGFVMHWSRLVDAPIAALIGLFTWLSNDQLMGETLALTFWPLLLLAAAIYFIVRAAISIGGQAAALPATLLALPSLAIAGKFGTGSIDHHNVQLVLTAASLSFLLEARDRPALAMWAGIAAGVSISIGMEAAPYVACSGMVVASGLLLGRKSAGQIAIRFGSAFATTTVLVFLATVDPASWGIANCDALSLPHLACAAIGGLGLALTGWVQARRASTPLTLLMLAAVAGATAVTMALAYPQCLAGPYSGLHVRTQAWIGNIREVRSAWEIIQAQPSVAAALYCTPLLAVIVCVLGLLRPEQRDGFAVSAIYVLVSLIVAVWQIRGASFALGLATIPLAVWVARRWAAAVKGLPSARLQFVLACLLSLNLTWLVAGQLFGDAFAQERGARSPISSQSCDGREYASLDRFPATTVLNDFNGGAPILLYTHHRALAGPYHRNEGSLTALDIRMAEPDNARQMLRQRRIGLVAFCSTDDGLERASTFPSYSLHARLMRGETPEWLQLVSGNGRVRVYRNLDVAN